MMHSQMIVWPLGNGRRVQFIHVRFKMPIRSPRGDVGTTFIGQEKEKNLVKDTKELYGNQLF